MRNRTTQKHRDWWEKRKIDWNEAYLKTWQHPHRYAISAVLSEMDWFSLMEIGCGAGANLVNLVHSFPGRQLGGVDVNQDAIDMANKALTNAHLQVGRGDDLMISDDATDVVLTDMYLIYVAPKDIKKHLTEILRIARTYVVFCEFHSSSWWERFKIRWQSGYHVHDYVKLLEEMGFYNVQRYRLTPELWPGGGYQEKVGYIITAKVPKIKNI